MRRLNTQDTNFPQELAKLLSLSEEDLSSIESVVTGILQKVKTQGDAAVLELTNQFDRLNANAVADLELSNAELQEALRSLGLEVITSKSSDFHYISLKLCSMIKDTIYTI